MIAKLLHALFGARTPTDLARASQARWETWLRPIGAGDPVGADLAYEDDFLAIRDEVAKLSDINDALIIETAERLLKHCAKDVRPAIYYAYARMRRDGAEGLACGLELLCALVDRFGEQVLPRRAESRKAALEWLAGATFANRLERLEGLEGILLERSLSAVALLAERTAQWPAAGRPELEGLFRRFETRLEQAQDTAQVALPTAALLPHAAGTAMLPAAADLGSSRDLLERARQMASFLREQPHGYLAAYRLLRCIRWDMLADIPPHDAGGRTRLPGPRPELRAHLKRLLLQRQWLELLERVEQAFAEGANHFWLDLQCYAHTAQEQSAGDYAQAGEIAATDCALMLRRLPGIERLGFADGTPFAEDATLEWIARHATVRDVERGVGMAPVALAASHPDWAEMEAQAGDMLGQHGLEASLAWLQGLPSQQGARDHFTRQLVMARVAERADRADTAVHLLTVAGATAARFDLDSWEPALAFEAKAHLLRLLKVRASRKDADKALLAQRMDALIGELTALDPARAVGLA